MVKTIEIRGVPHAYELTAPTDNECTLVFVHGWLLSREYWQPLIQRLSSTYQCLSYDLRGFGLSQPQTTAPAIAQRPASALVSSGYSDRREHSELPANLPELTDRAIAPVLSDYVPAAYAQDLAVLLKELNITKAWLVGHSLGGSIALWTAEQTPQTVSGVICVNSGGGIYLKEEFERFRAAGQQLVKLRPRWLCYLPLIDLLLSRMNVVRPIARRWGRQRLIDLVMAHSEAAIGTLLESTTEAEVHLLPQLVSRLQQPVYFIAGANDPIMEPQYVRHLASFHPLFQCSGNNVMEIPQCGHLSMLEQPDAVADQINQILTQHPT